MIEPINVPIILDVEEAEEYGAQLASLITINKVYGGLPSEGIAGDILIKNSEEDYDASWCAPASVVEDGNGLPVTSDAVYDAVSVKYTKPSNGIPADDLAERAISSRIWWTNGQITYRMTMKTIPINQLDNNTPTPGGVPLVPRAGDIVVGPKIGATDGVPRYLYTIGGVLQGTPYGDLAVLQDFAPSDYDGAYIGPLKVSELQNDSGFGTYTKPVGGIPKSDLEAAVQSSLDKADTALQEHQDISGKLDKTGGTMSGNINMGQNWIKNMHAGTAAYDAVNLKQVQDMIAEGAATYRGSFQTRSDLEVEPWQDYDPTQEYYVNINDFAIVLTDETHNNECWKYIYTDSWPYWEPEYKINDSPLSQAQLDALNSGITAVKVSEFEAKYNKPNTGIPASDMAEGVATKLWFCNQPIRRVAATQKIAVETTVLRIWNSIQGSSFEPKKYDLVIGPDAGNSSIVKNGNQKYLYIINSIETIGNDKIAYLDQLGRIGPEKTSELQNDSGFGTYSKPNDGIPASDLASDVHLIPSGGTIGQVLRKISDNDWDIEWGGPIEDGTQIWWTDRVQYSTQDSVRTYWASKYTLRGKDGVVAAADDYVYGPHNSPLTTADPDALFVIDRIQGSYAYLTFVCSIKGTDGVGVPSGGTTGQVLKKASGTDYDTEWVDERNDYSDLTNKPQINSVTLSGNKSLSDLGIEPEAFVVTITQSGSTYSADKTFAQISAAHTANRRVVALLGDLVYNLDKINIDAFFSVVDGTYLRIIVIAEDNVIHDVSRYLGTYSKPSGGIPKTDLASAVQASLDKADTALQPGDVSEPFFVTYSTSDMTTWTCDKTFAQITAAMAAGKQIVMIGSVGGSPIAQGSDILLSTDGTYYYIEFWIRYSIIGWYRITHYNNDSIYFAEKILGYGDVDAVAATQGVAHAGEFLVVGSDGNVTTVNVPVYNGGSY